MEYILHPSFYGLAPEILLRVNEASEKFINGIKRTDVSQSGMTDYNKKYLRNYLSDPGYYLPLYNQLLLKAIRETEKPIGEITFLDYGGGCGIMALLAKAIGFRCVLFNDLFAQSVADAKILASLSGIAIDHFIPGDMEDVVRYCSGNNLKPDLVCSFDVIEHIYDLSGWFTTLKKFEHSFSLLFMTHINPCNPVINHKIKKIQRKMELEDQVRTFEWKENDSDESYLKIRKRIIAGLIPEGKFHDLDFLAAGTRGLQERDIGKAVEEYLETGTITYQPDHPTNTCDPMNGNGAENLINLRRFRKMITGLGFRIRIVNNFYSYSANKFANLLKRFLNLLIRITGKKNLLVSPSYTVIIKS